MKTSRKPWIRAAFVLSAALSLAGCKTKLAGTAKLTGPGTTTTTLHVTGPIVLWAHWDLVWETVQAPPVLVYDLEVKQPGKPTAKITCSTAEHGSEVCGIATKRQINNVQQYSTNCETELRCAFPNVTGDVQVTVTAHTTARLVPQPSNRMDLDFRTPRQP